MNLFELFQFKHEWRLLLKTAVADRFLVILLLVHRHHPNLFLVSRIQGEPQRHSTPLTLGDGSDTVGIFLPSSEPNHTAALWTHLGLKKCENTENATFHSSET